MARQTAEKLYSPRLLALSTQLARFPLTGDFSHRCEVRSKTCGSTIDLGVDLDPGGKIARLGLQVSACAVGQSSAAIMAMNAVGQSADVMADVHDAAETWLSGGAQSECSLPDWPQFDALEPALGHTGRYGAIILPWTAITRALSSEASSR